MNLSVCRSQSSEVIDLLQNGFEVRFKVFDNFRIIIDSD